ncbi:MAG: sirohydrochlorin chelatase [Carbonactinosporaceae bacterium]
MTGRCGEHDDPVLLGIAHGSRDPRSPATVEALLARVRAQSPGLRVESAYLDHCSPSVPQVVDRLARAGCRTVVAVPLLLSAAYHARVDIPAALHRGAQRHPRLALRVGRTLGPDALLVAALERRLREAGVGLGDPETGVVLASAGTSDPTANAVVERVARRWARAGWADVVTAFASAAPPTVGEAVAGLRRRGVPRVAVSRYFLAPGRLPDRVRTGAGATGSPSGAAADAVTAVLGDAPEVAELVLRRYDEVLASRLSA